MPDVDPHAVCDFCGKRGARPLGDRLVCDDCYAAKGSCCPEFGADDLWREPTDRGDAGRTDP